jgi:hypothetical protein
MKTNEFHPYTGQQYSEQEIVEQSENFLQWADTRRSVRDFLQSLYLNRSWKT